MSSSWGASWGSAWGSSWGGNSGPPINPMPDFVGLEYFQALVALRDAGFITTEPIERKVHAGPGTQMGYVIDQSIKAGTVYVPGSLVILTVNKPFGQFPAGENNQPIPYWYFLQR